MKTTRPKNRNEKNKRTMQENSSEKPQKLLKKARRRKNESRQIARKSAKIKKR